MKCCGLSLVFFLSLALNGSVAGDAAVNSRSLPSSGDTFGVLLETADLWLGLPRDRNAMVLAKLPEGTKVKILDKKEDYYRVMHKTLIGYVDQQAIGLVGDNLKALKPKPESNEQITPIPNSHSPHPVDQQNAIKETAYYITKATSLRASPNSKARVYLRFAPDDKIVSVLDKSNRYWWEVVFKGHTGWVKCALLQKRP